MIRSQELGPDVRDAVFNPSFCPADDPVCPHVSFENPKASVDAPARESVETRSVVVTLASDDP